MGHDKGHALDSADHTAPVGNISLNSNKIINLADPTAASDASTKSYVDAIAVGLDIKASCRLATNAALPFGVAVYANGSSGVGATLTGFGFGALTVDGITAAVGDRILVKDQATAAHHGIYTVTVTGGVATLFVLTRATDFDQAAELAEGDFTFIEEGTVNAHQGWLLTTAGPYTMGTTSLSFTQFSAAGEYVAGTGISISGTTIAISDSSSTPAAIGTASAGTTTNAPSASNHVHATGAGTPSTQLHGDSAVTGSGPAASMTDHKHALANLSGDVTTTGSMATTLAAGSAANLNSGTLLAARMPALTGDVTTSAGAVATSIASNAVTLAKMATQANNTILGNNSGSTAVPSALTAAQTLGVLGIQFGTVATSNFLFTTSDATNMQSVTGLSFTIGVSSTEVWLVELFILMQSVNTAMDSIWQFTVPTAATYLMGGSGMSALGSVSGTQAWGIQGASGSSNGLSATTTIVGSANATNGIGLTAIVFGGGTSGTVQLQGRQNTSDAGQLTAKIGSTLRATQVHT